MIERPFLYAGAACPAGKAYSKGQEANLSCKDHPLAAEDAMHDTSLRV